MNVDIHVAEEYDQAEPIEHIHGNDFSENPQGTCNPKLDKSVGQIAVWQREKRRFMEDSRGIDT